MSRLVAIDPHRQAAVAERVEQHLADGGALIDLPRYVVAAIAGVCPERNLASLHSWLGPHTAAVMTEDRVDVAQVIERLNGVRSRLAITLATQAALAERRAFEHAERKTRARIPSGTRERFTGFPDQRALAAAGGIATVLDGAWIAVKDSMTAAVIDASRDKEVILAKVTSEAAAQTQAEQYRRRGLEAVAFLLSLLAARTEGRISGGRIPTLGPNVRRASQFIEGASGALDQEAHQGPPRIPPDILAAVATAPDQRMVWTWMHSFYGVPQRPFDPHVDIDAEMFSSAELESLEWFPGDHEGCLCETIPEMTVF